MNGGGQRMASPSIRHLPFLHHLEQGRLRFAGARLSSSASNRFVKAGPFRSRNVLGAHVIERVAVTSLGMRSGVN
jgi:hypothetical protein